MKKIGVLMAAILFSLAGLTGCGSDTETITVKETVYVEVPASQTTGSFKIEQSSKEQELILNLNEAAQLQGLQGLGTMQYLPTDVSLVMYISDRQLYEKELTRSADGKSVSIVFEDTVNNDKPQIIFLMSDGEQYPVYMKELSFSSSEPIQFSATDWGFEYGNEEYTGVNVSRNENDTIDFDIEFGCDKLVGLLVDVDPKSIGGVAWETEDGTLYPASIEQNNFGSYRASIKNVPLLIAPCPDTNYWQGMGTIGKLIVFSKNGLRIPFAHWSTSDFEWNYSYDWDVIRYENPYWDIPGKEGMIKFYIPVVF